MLKIKCDHCFKFYSKEIKKIRWNKKINNRNFCSKKCQSLAKTTKIELRCTNCNKNIFKIPAQLKRSKSKNHFCSRHCATIINNKIYKRGKNHPSYENGTSLYRKKALSHYDNKCAICEYNVVEILEIHHIDNNRLNNELKNLQILCPTHHKEFTLKLRV